ncbi:CHAT domain-containing protein [Chloroflexi bacterium TSY]|nr:CHAT domain-containing protein [Chloroflexi bacterium TSY]
MNNDHFVNFDITIRVAPSQSQQPPFILSASYKTRLADSLFHLCSTDPYWTEALDTLADPNALPGMELLVDMGGRLFREVMQGAVRDLWIAAMTDLENGRSFHLRIRLAIHPATVACLPWECFYDPDRNRAFAADGEVSLVRIEQLYHQVAPSRKLLSSPPVKILVAIPEDPSDQIQADREIKHIMLQLSSLGKEYVSIVTLSGRFNITELRRTMEQEQPDILHLMSHGEPDGLLFWEDAKLSLVPTQSLRVTLQRTPSIKLVFCQISYDTGWSSELVSKTG